MGLRRERAAFSLAEGLVAFAKIASGGPGVAQVALALALGRALGGWDEGRLEAVLGLVRRSWEAAR